MLLDEDTIAAVSTPVGKGAIAIVRVSGPCAHEIGQRLLSRWPTRARDSLLAVARDEAGFVVDQGLITKFHAGSSFTGEDMFEFSGHGGLAAPVAVLSAVLHAGARLARKGEFTQRALLNGRLDLVQAEAIGDLIDAETQAQRRITASQVGGVLSAASKALLDGLIELEALVAYDLDFPEEDDGPVSRDRVRQTAQGVLEKIDRLLATVSVAEIARAGAIVVIAGPPNSGKSSLFNALVGQDRAIVTEHPGTTRDAIEVVLDDDEIPLRLVDTAGLRETEDAIEKIGIEVSLRQLARAHVVLACSDSEADLVHTADLIRATKTTADIIAVRTKSDLMSEQSASTLAVSSTMRTGLTELLAVVRETVRLRCGTIPPETPVVTRTRQELSLRSAKNELQLFLDHWKNGALPAVVAAVHIRHAAHAVEELVGRIDVESVLGAVFERFCIGK